MLDGKQAYSLGYGGCQTCSFLFQRLSGANHPAEIEATAEALRKGVDSLDDEVVETIGRGLPEGEYNALLCETSVTLAIPGGSNDYYQHEQVSLWGEDMFWCLPHDPRVPYFRAGDSSLEPGKRLFNFVIPMIPTRWLSMTTIAKYEEALKTKSSGTAVSIAVLDVRGPSDWNDSRPPDPLEHWCLAHFILDGHHKLNAAMQTGKPLKLLSFVALSPGVSERSDVDRTVAHLRADR